MKVELKRVTDRPEELVEDLVHLSYRTQNFPVHPTLVRFKSGRTIPLRELNMDRLPVPGEVIPGFEKDDRAVDKIIPRTAEKAVKFAIAINHLALFRQVFVTWDTWLSRKSVLHYLRYQHTAENLVSQKYLDQAQFEYIMPTTRDYSEAELKVFEEAMASAQSYYETLRGFGWDPEDARLVYPNSCLQHFIFTANLETMRRLFDILCDEDYVDEMHRFGLAMLSQIKRTMPSFVYDYKFYRRTSDDHIFAKRIRRNPNVKVNWFAPSLNAEIYSKWSELPEAAIFPEWPLETEEEESEFVRLTDEQIPLPEFWFTNHGGGSE